MSLLGIIQNKKVRIIFLLLLAFVIIFQLERGHKKRDEVVQAYNYFVENKDFISVEFDLYVKGTFLERLSMSVDEVERLWPIIRKANPGSGTKKVFDILIIVYYTRKDGSVTTIKYRKDFGVEQVRISFYLTGKAGYSLIGEDYEGIINEFASLVRQ